LKVVDDQVKNLPNVGDNNKALLAVEKYMEEID